MYMGHCHRCCIARKRRITKLIHCFSSPPSQKTDAGGRAAGNGRLITSLMGNGRQNHKFSNPKSRGGIVLVLMEIHAGGNQGGMN